MCRQHLLFFLTQIGFPVRQKSQILQKNWHLPYMPKYSDCYLRQFLITNYMPMFYFPWLYGQLKGLLVLTNVTLEKYVKTDQQTHLFLRGCWWKINFLCSCFCTHEEFFTSEIWAPVLEHGCIEHMIQNSLKWSGTVVFSPLQKLRVISKKIWCVTVFGFNL